MTENIYIPPLTRTINPPEGHFRTVPDCFHINDEERKEFFTNFDDELIKRIRQYRLKNKPIQ